MRVNLLPKELRPFDARPIIAAVVVLAVALVAPLGYFTWDARQTVQDNKAHLDQLQSRVASLADITSLAAKRDSLRQEWNAMVAASPAQRQLAVTTHLEQLTAILPANVYVTEVSLDHDNVSFRAGAPDYQTVVQFMGAIVACTYFADTPRLSALRSSADGYSFSVAVQVLGGER